MRRVGYGSLKGILISCSIVATLSGLVTGNVIQQPLHSETFREHDTNGAVASENVRCSQIGIDLMRQGGNAADAVRRS
jgi:hypothetical protein